MPWVSDESASRHLIQTDVPGTLELPADPLVCASDALVLARLCEMVSGATSAATPRPTGPDGPSEARTVQGTGMRRWSGIAWRVGMVLRSSSIPVTRCAAAMAARCDRIVAIQPSS